MNCGARFRAGAALLVVVASVLVGLGAPAGAGETSGSEPSGGETETDYGRMILVLDSSGSMKEPAGDGSTKIDAAKQALSQVVGELPADADVGLRVFGAKVFSRRDQGACTDSQLVVQPGIDNREALQTAIDEYRPFGETPIAYALRQASRDIGNEGTRSIVLVSDGIATCEPDPCVVAGELAERGIDLQIDVVGISVDPAARSQLRCIAARGNGTYYDADSATDIVESLGTASRRALRPFGIDGEPIDGGPTQAKATPIEAGRYADRKAAREEEKWYRFERTMPGSTVIISQYELVPGSQHDFFVDVMNEDGTSCGGGPTPIFHEIFTGYADLVAADENCSGPLLIQLRSGVGQGSPTDFGIGVVEEPAITDEDSQPPAIENAQFKMPKATRPGTPIVPGSDFESAAELESGQTYAATIVPGEAQAYRIHVGWGQQLNVRVDRPDLTAKQDDLVGGALGGFDLQLMNPVRASIDDTVQGVDNYSDLSLGDAERQTVAAFPVQWNNRFGTSPAYLPGDYLILYQANFYDDEPVELSYRITAEVTGQEEPGPTYADGAELVIDPPTPTPTPTEQDGAQAGDQAGGASGTDRTLGGTRIALAAGLGVIAILTLVMGGVLLRRSRQQ